MLLELLSRLIRLWVQISPRGQSWEAFRKGGLVQYFKVPPAAVQQRCGKIQAVGVKKGENLNGPQAADEAMRTHPQWHESTFPCCGWESLLSNRTW